jgi:hypothetical protein
MLKTEVTGLVMKKRIVNGRQVELRQGRLFVEGQYRFLKIGKPLRNFGEREEIEQLIADLDVIKSKQYNCIELNCYWHHMDRDGDGVVDVDVEPLRRLIDEINERGMFACLSVETYGVGGGQIPDGFWEEHPGNIAVGIDGKEVSDTEFGYLSKVPSLYSEDYLRLSRAYITDLASKIDASKILYFETTVEPQYMGDVWIDYSERAKEAYTVWIERNEISGAQPFPAAYPVAQEFIYDPTWNRFRAEWLAGWVSGDAEAFRAAAGPDAWVACDYLDPEESTVLARNGDPVVFLRGLGAIDIIQVNWHWHYADRAPNLKAYQRVRQVNEETGRDWVIAEHMTINGTDYQPEEMEGLLLNTIRNSTRFGWEFVDVAADPDGPDVPEGEVLPGFFKPAHFAVYDKDWNPKPSMAVVDKQWDRWMEEIHSAAGIKTAEVA